MTGHPLGVTPAEPGSLHEQNETAHRSGFLIPEAIRAELLANVLGARLVLGEPPTPEDRAAHKARRAAADAAVVEAHARLLTAAAGEELALAVLELHRPEGASCAGDDWSGYEGEPPDWPCRTAAVIAARIGVEVPDDPWWDAFLKAGES